MRCVTRVGLALTRPDKVTEESVRLGDNRSTQENQHERGDAPGHLGFNLRTEHVEKGRRFSYWWVEANKLCLQITCDVP
jgi:hypothetical protein